METFETIDKLIFLLGRYAHIVAAALLVGGTLFYEMVVPQAIEDLKNESQLSVFARARWVFKGVVLASVALLVTTGVLSLYRNWEAYRGRDEQISEHLSNLQGVQFIPPAVPVHWWVIGHAILGTVGATIAVVLVMGRTPPSKPIRWMRLNLAILLVAIFLASAARHVRLSMLEQKMPPLLRHLSGS
jgi:hypothetical protein